MPAPGLQFAGGQPLSQGRRAGSRVLAGCLMAALMAAMCGKPTTVSVSSPVAPSAETDPCAPLTSASGGPVADPAGPYYHQVVVARSDDGVRVTDARQVLEHASVPDGVRLPDGSVLIYYVNGATGSVWVARFDGTAASPIGPISLNGLASPAGVVDPDATLLASGSVRLAYLAGFGPPASATSRAMCLADAVDGVNFTVVRTALTLAATDMATDPSLARLADGSWLMAVSRGQQTMLARSAAGISFTPGEILPYGGVPEVASLPDGRVRLYVCAGGIESYVSADLGATWSREAVVVPPGTLGKRIVCDPSWVAGASLFIFKTAD